MPKFALLLWLLIGGSIHAEELAAARGLYAAQRYAEAEQAFATVVEENPANVEAHHHLGKLARKRQDLAAAILHFEKARALAPDDPAVQFDYGAACSLHADTLGLSFRAAALARRGRIALERAVALAPTEPRYHEGLIEFYQTAPGIVGGSMAKAYQQADALAAIAPLPGTLALANLKLKEKRPDDTLDLWSTFLRTHPDDPVALFQFGRTAALAGIQLERGIATLERCLEVAPPPAVVRPAEIHWRLGQLREQAGDIPGALREYRLGLNFEPGHAAVAADHARLADSP